VSYIAIKTAIRHQLKLFCEIQLQPHFLSFPPAYKNAISVIGSLVVLGTGTGT